MTTKTKRKPTGDPRGDTEGRRAGRRGGDSTLDIERNSASTKSKCLGESKFETVDVGAKTSAGENSGISEKVIASRKSNGRNGSENQIASENGHASICGQLQELQRSRSVNLKSRMMIDNRLRMSVATAMGYSAGLDEAERKAKQERAEELIAAIDKGKVPAELQDVADMVSGLVSNTRVASKGFDVFLKGIEKEMCILASQLGPAKWINSVRGVGLKSLATIVGEAGDLSNYANPGKLWKRLGLAPFNGKMPSTWRFGKEGTLTSEQWSELGYSPRRRSVMYVIGECIVKQNDGAYRARYDEAKLKAAENHADWIKGRCHNHAMLLATKRLVLDLWKQWRGDGYTESEFARVTPKPSGRSKLLMTPNDHLSGRK